MRHRIGFNALSRRAAQRKALKRSLVTSLFKYERIETTKAKAKATQQMAEKMITRAKVDSVHNRRMVGKDLKDEAVLAKLFTEIAPLYVDRNGGYTRVLKLGHRKGDAAEMALLELIMKTDEPKKRSSAKEKKRESKESAPKEAPASSETASE